MFANNLASLLSTVMDMIENIFVRHRIPNGVPSRLIYRSLYVCLIGFIAITIPFFGSLMVSTCMLHTWAYFGMYSSPLKLVKLGSMCYA